MSRLTQFGLLLPVGQTVLAGLCGGVGLWQRNRILSHASFLGGTWWDSTARFHVWPWPFKLAVISNMPAYLAGLLLAVPIGIVWPHLSEAAQLAPSLIFVAVLWYLVGRRLDRRWRRAGATAVSLGTRTPWILLLVFTAVCLFGTFLPLGDAGYLPYGILIWLVTAVTIIRMTKTNRSATMAANGTG
jgi:hypothetical protein